MAKEEIIRELTSNKDRADYMRLAQDLVGSVSGITDDELTEVFDLISMINVRRTVNEIREVVGEEALFYDLVVILGSERGLWDENGYKKELFERNHRNMTEAMGEQGVEMVRKMQAEKRPLLVNLVLFLKYEVRNVGDRHMMELNQMVDDDWPQDDGDKIFRLRITTLRLALGAVLIDRGLVPNKVQSRHV